MIERINRKSLSLNFAKSTYFLICGFSINLQTGCLLEYRLNAYKYETKKHHNPFFRYRNITCDCSCMQFARSSCKQGKML